MMATVAASEREEEIAQRNCDHLAGREKCLAGIAIDHRPEERAEHEEDADDAEDNGRVREKQDLDQNEDDAEHEKRDDFPARQASQIMAEEKKRETNRGNNPRHARARNLELEISANDSQEEKQRRERRDPKREPLEAAGIERQPARLSVRPFRARSCDRIGDAVGQERFAVDLLGRFLRGQSQERAFRMHDAVADFHFLLLVMKASPMSGLWPLRVAELRMSADQ